MYASVARCRQDTTDSPDRLTASRGLYRVRPRTPRTDGRREEVFEVLRATETARTRRFS